MNEKADTIEMVPYLISAHGVYRCVTYLLRGQYDSWHGRGPYSYSKVRQRLLACFSTRPYDGMNQKLDVYDGRDVWERFFLKDPLLAERIKHQGFTSLEQLHHYADTEANK